MDKKFARYMNYGKRVADHLDSTLQFTLYMMYIKRMKGER